MTTVDTAKASIFTAAIGICSSESSAQVSTLPRVIIETDMCADTDDAALVAFCNRLADEGAIELIAVMHNANNEWGGAAISAINTYYGRSRIPIGTYRTAAEANRPDYHPLLDPNQPNGPRRALSYIGTSVEGGWVRLLADNFPCRYARRLEFPDAVDVYSDVLSSVPDDSVIIVNGGFLGNLSNLVARFDVDAGLGALFARKVRRMTAAVGGVNTCDNNVFPRGMAEHVFENTRHETALGTALGAPIVGVDATRTTSELGLRLAIDNPVREAYRYKTEVEHGRRGTSREWEWHIIDVLTAYSVIAWDTTLAPDGTQMFDLRTPGWLDVLDNCVARVRTGPGPVPHLRFQEAGPAVPPGYTMVQATERFRRRFFDDGLYPRPANGWSRDREHLNVTALFEDGTFGGFDFNRGHGGTRVESGRLIVPTSTTPNYGGASLIVAGRRYFDQTYLMRVSKMPAVDQYAISATSQAEVDFYFWGDARSSSGFGDAPLVRMRAWPGRGVNGSPGRAVYNCEVWQPTASGYQRVVNRDVVGLPVGAAFTLRVEVSGSTVAVAVDGRDVFADPVQLSCAPPADGGYSQLRMSAKCPVQQFEVEHALLRPEAGPKTQIDVHVDKVGTVWFSYLRNGNLQSDLFGSTQNFDSHIVDMRFAQTPGVRGSIPVRMPWFDGDPSTLDWVTAITYADWHGLGVDHWIYGLRVPWTCGDEVVLEYQGRREGEQVPFEVLR